MHSAGERQEVRVRLLQPRTLLLWPGQAQCPPRAERRGRPAAPQNQVVKEQATVAKRYSLHESKSIPHEP